MPGLSQIYRCEGTVRQDQYKFAEHSVNNIMRPELWRILLMSAPSCRIDLSQLLPPTTNFTTKQHILLLVVCWICYKNMLEGKRQFITRKQYAGSTARKGARKTVAQTPTYEGKWRSAFCFQGETQWIMLGENPMNSIEENTGMPNQKGHL